MILLSANAQPPPLAAATASSRRADTSIVILQCRKSPPTAKERLESAHKCARIYRPRLFSPNTKRRRRKGTGFPNLADTELFEGWRCLKKRPRPWWKGGSRYQMLHSKLQCYESQISEQWTSKMATKMIIQHNSISCSLKASPSPVDHQ